LKLPNKTHPDSPIGSENNNKLIRVGGPALNEVKEKNRKNVSKETQKVRSHLEIGELFDLFDFKNAAKLTGSKFVFLKNEAAILELALVNWALN
jgi:seryl-tRNA synthetase